MKKLSFIFAALFVAGFTMAQDNTATVKQFGENIGSVSQTGSDNNAKILQGTKDVEVTNNRKLQYAGDWKEGSFIDQVGENNTAKTTVRTSGNGTSISQDGERNKGFQDVGSFNEETTDWTKMGLDIEQKGKGNWATQKTSENFGCPSGIAGMTIIQKGDHNIADQVSMGGYGGNQSIKQIGDNNNNTVKSGNVFDLSSTTLNNTLLAFTTLTLPLTQYSNQNGGSAIMNVKGDNNNTYQFQKFSVWETSGHNDAMLDLKGDKNNIFQGQLGESNNSDLDIHGDGNVVSTSQVGDWNVADVNIRGDYNVVGIQQTGSGHEAYVTQNGSNFAKVVQQNSTVCQN